MRKLAYLLALTLALSVTYTVAQERASDKKPPTFEELHAALATSWSAGRYKACLNSGRDLMAMVTEKWNGVILAALPAAPEGFEIEPQRVDAAAQNMGLAMSGLVGSVIQQNYRGAEGSERIQVTITADSPVIGMFNMWVANPQMLGENAELVTYGEFKAVLEKSGRKWNLKVVIDNSLLEVDLSGRDDEFLLRVFNQAAIDSLAAALRG